MQIVLVFSGAPAEGKSISRLSGANSVKPGFLTFIDRELSACDMLDGDENDLIIR